MSSPIQTSKTPGVVDPARESPVEDPLARAAQGRREDPRDGRIIQSVDRALNILERLLISTNGLSLQELSREVGLHASTCHHLLYTLARRGYVTQNRQSRNYRIGSRLYDLQIPAEAHQNLIGQAMPHLVQLNEITGEAIHLAVLMADELVTLAKLESIHAVKVDSSMVGKSNAVHATATGKAILAHLPEQEVDAIIRKQGLSVFTPLTLTDPGALKKNLRKVRDKGYSEDRQEFQPFVHCVGAPIWDHKGEVVASISCASPSMRINKNSLKEIRRRVMTAANEISIALGADAAHLIAP